MLLALLAVVPGWWLYRHMETGFMPEMDEGAFVLDYWDAGGHVAVGEPTRCSAGSRPCWQDTPDIGGYIRRTGAEPGFSPPSRTRATSS